MSCDNSPRKLRPRPVPAGTERRDRDGDRDPVPVPVLGPIHRTSRAFRDPTIMVLAVITLASAGALVLGYGPTGGGGNGGSGPLYSIGGGDDGPERISLTIETNRSDIRVGQPVAITVVGPDGRPTPNATVTVGDTRYRTGSNGTIVHAFRAGGTHRIVANKIGTETVIYERDHHVVRVDRVVVTLSVRTNVTRATVGEPVSVTVITPDGDPTAATVMVGDRTVRTPEDGSAVVTFGRAGNYTVDADRPPTNTTRFRVTSTSLVIERRVVGLSVGLNTTRPLVDQDVTVTVTRTDTGEPTNATVLVGTTRRWTGADGRVVVSFAQAGTSTVTAAASETPAVRFQTVTRVVPVDRRTVSLELTVSPRRPERGERVAVTLRRTDTGEPVDGDVRIGGDSYRTGDDGTVRLTFDIPGEVLARGLKDPTRVEVFRMSYAWVDVRGPYFRISGVEVPEMAPAGSTVTVNATVSNRGNEPGVATVSLGLAGRHATRELSLAPGENGRVRIPITVPDQRGTDTLRISVDGDDQVTHPITVTPNPNGTADRTVSAPR